MKSPRGDKPPPKLSRTEPLAELAASPPGVPNPATNHNFVPSILQGRPDRIWDMSLPARSRCPTKRHAKPPFPRSQCPAPRFRGIRKRKRRRDSLRVSGTRNGDPRRALPNRLPTRCPLTGKPTIRSQSPRATRARPPRRLSPPARNIPVHPPFPQVRRVEDPPRANRRLAMANRNLQKLEIPVLVLPEP